MERHRRIGFWGRLAKALFGGGGETTPTFPRYRVYTDDRIEGISAGTLYRLMRPVDRTPVHP